MDFFFFCKKIFFYLPNIKPLLPQYKAPSSSQKSRPQHEAPGRLYFFWGGGATQPPPAPPHHDIPELSDGLTSPAFYFELLKTLLPMILLKFENAQNAVLKNYFVQPYSVFHSPISSNLILFSHFNHKKQFWRLLSLLFFLASFIWFPPFPVIIIGFLNDPLPNNKCHPPPPGIIGPRGSLAPLIGHWPLWPMTPRGWGSAGAWLQPHTTCPLPGDICLIYMPIWPCGHRSITPRHVAAALQPFHLSPRCFFLIFSDFIDSRPKFVFNLRRLTCYLFLSADTRSGGWRIACPAPKRSPPILSNSIPIFFDFCIFNHKNIYLVPAISRSYHRDSQ